MSHDESHDRCGKIVHRPCNSCISSVENLTGTLIEFSLSNAEQRDSWLNSGHRTLAADNLLDELAKGESEVKSVEQLFTKIRNDFGKTSEEERKIEQLQTME